MSSNDDHERKLMESWAKQMQKPHSAKRLPPIKMIMYPDIMEKAWGWERLMLYISSIPLSPCYLDYLREYHRRNGLHNAAAGAGGAEKIDPEQWPLKARAVHQGGAAADSGDGKTSMAAAAKFCLKMEMEFMSVWRRLVQARVRNVKNLSRQVQERAQLVISAGEEFSETAAAALVCIAKEAALACELLKRGTKATDDEIKLCNQIRHCALSLMDMKGAGSDAAAAMVGVAKEARLITEWMRETDELYVSGSYRAFHKVDLCDEIRKATLYVMRQILEKTFTGGKNGFELMDFGKKNRQKEKKRQEKRRMAKLENKDASSRSIAIGDEHREGNDSVHTSSVKRKISSSSSSSKAADKDNNPKKNKKKQKRDCTGDGLGQPEIKKGNANKVQPTIR